MFFSWSPRSACPIVATSDCCVSIPFGSVGIVLQNQRRMCREYDSHPGHICLVFRSVRSGDVMNGNDSC